jgi:ABC-2 type transport system ATP-binding protein
MTSAKLTHTNGAVAAADERICAEGLSKWYGSRAAVDGLSLVARASEIVGLLGPNGAGKTTTLSMLSGVIAPDTGNVQISGLDLAANPIVARRKLGLVPQSIALYPTLTALENLRFFGKIQGLGASDAAARASRLLETVGLCDRANDIVAGFSGGMKRRLNLACGMIHSPAVLLLDEPTVGVDPQSRGRIFEIVEAAAATGTAVIYSTHYMEEVERLCGRVILIDHGHVVAGGTTTELIALAGSAPRIDVMTRDELKPGWCDGIGRAVVFADGARFGASLELVALDQAPEVIRRAERAGGEVLEVHLHRPNLQDAFLKLTGHALRDSQ